MASSAAVAKINGYLSPYMFQVIGSTPTSVMESIKKANIRNNADSGIGLATTAIFAAAVNKSTLETFLAQAEMVAARSVVSVGFSISGKTNMTGLTLLGHCLLTTSFISSISFVKEFRNKMGQDDIWAGDFKTGSLSDKRKEILLEKKRVTNENQAILLGSGYFKYIGVDNTAWTQAEADFWMLTETARPAAKPFVSASGSGAGSGSTPVAAPRRGNMNITLSDNSVVTVTSRAYDFYMGRNNNDINKLIESIEHNGATAWNEKYTDIVDKGKDSVFLAGSTTLG